MGSSQVTVGMVLTGQMDLKMHGSLVSPTGKHLMKKHTSGVLKICRTIVYNTMYIVCIKIILSLVYFCKLMLFFQKLNDIMISTRDELNQILCNSAHRLADLPPCSNNTELSTFSKINHS